MSLHRGGADDLTTHQELDKFRGSSVDLQGWQQGSGRRMSITNAIDILQRHVLRAIRRKKDKQVLDPAVL